MQRLNKKCKACNFAFLLQIHTVSRYEKNENLLEEVSAERDRARSEILEPDRCPENAAHCLETAVLRETMARLRNEPVYLSACLRNLAP